MSSNLSSSNSVMDHDPHAARSLLDGEGFSVRAFVNGEDLPKAFSGLGLPCVFIDRAMPGLCGLNGRRRAKRLGCERRPERGGILDAASPRYGGRLTAILA
jgi:CheY-like chemotaxis protein